VNALTPEQAEHLRKLAVAEFWRRRAFWPLLDHYLDRDQLEDIRAFFAGVNAEAGELPTADWYDEISRQRGKSFKWTVLAVVWCHCHARQSVKYAAQLGKSVRRIIWPTIKALVADMPPEFRGKGVEPQEKKGATYGNPEAVGVIREDRSDHTWFFPNGSDLLAAGVNMDHEDDLRGTRAHIFIKDECAFYTDFTKVERVSQPQTFTTHGVSVYATTPPEDPGHPVRQVRESLKTVGRYIHRTIYKHPRFDEAYVDKFLAKQAETRGETLAQFKRSTFYRREYLCLWVAEETRAVVPDWNYPENDEAPEEGTLGDSLIYAKDELPEFFAPLEALDLGFTKDPSGYLFAFWDFKEAALCIHDELPPMVRKRTDEQADAIRSVRKKWLPATRRHPYPEAKRYEDPKRPDDGHWVPYLSVGDAGGFGAEKLAELRKEEGIDFLHAKKTDLETMANGLRQLVRAGKLRVNKRCKHIITQLATGLWADKGKTDLEKSGAHHNDHLAALIYLVAMLDAVRNFDPYPLNWGVDLANTITPERTRDGVAADVIKKVFG
jgi:hypothetical protein